MRSASLRTSYTWRRRSAETTDNGLPGPIGVLPLLSAFSSICLPSVHTTPHIRVIQVSRCRDTTSRTSGVAVKELGLEVNGAKIEAWFLTYSTKVTTLPWCILKPCLGLSTHHNSEEWVVSAPVRTNTPALCMYFTWMPTGSHYLLTPSGSWSTDRLEGRMMR